MAKREQPEDLVKSSAVHDELSDTDALALLTLEVKYDAGEFKNLFHDPYAFGAALLASFGGFPFGYAAQSYATIVASRSIGGIGVGTLAMGAPLYISEISPPAWRGSFWVLEAISIVTGAIGMERYRSQQALLKREYPDYARHPLLEDTSCLSIPFFQQLSGINAFVYYVPTFFEALGQSDNNSLILSGMVNVFMAIPHLVMVGTTNWFSREWATHQAVGWFCVALNYLNVLSYSVSYGPLAWVLPAEVFPRSKPFVVPEVLLKLGLGTYLLRRLFCVAATVFSFLFVPETTNKSLEQVAAVFGDGFVDEERNLQSRIAREVWHGSSHARRKRGYERGYRAGWWSGPIFERAIHPSERGTTFTIRGILFNLIPAT
ncbi:Fungal Zn(2)-Cys(6) binuclear cluster domain family protein [Aspergillus niger]|uniref:Fungal Zn(2)-Cys(6) binuclear cluster domain family protein n=1 Tax=Aspergillus niger TaxID=5061 RepID=A0A505HZW3_ASPNG|nr:Fungal Zn(2)-Cys(6) binuclear cluster domain family protein [Aspergillus niger]